MEEMIFPNEILKELTEQASEEIGPTILNVDLIRANLGSQSSEKICEMIVSDRYLGFGEKISVMCMEELARRRENGDPFDFENHIEEISKGLPDLGQITSGTGFDIRSIIQQAMRTK